MTSQGVTDIFLPTLMHTLKSQIDPKSKTFETNRAAMLSGLERLRGELAKANLGGGEKYNQRHLAKGKLLPRERIERLLDPGAHFLEIAPLAGLGMDGESPGAGVVAGIGVVSGIECVIIANEATVKAGAITEVGQKKLARLAEISFENRLPTIYLVESAGIDLPQQSKIFVSGGREFRDITRRSRLRIPTIAIVFGTSTAGGAYIPGMSDYVIMVKKEAHVFLGGPPLVKAATGEVIDEESLGGAEMHSQRSGVSDYLAENEMEGIGLAREILAHLHWKRGSPQFDGIEEPLYPGEELWGIPSANPKIPYDTLEILARIVDGSRFSEFKARYGSTLITGFASIHGFPVGILSNNGVLMSESAAKGAQFIQLCNQQDIPLIFFQNITGFIVGKKVEEEGIIKHGAKLINAVANSTVPAITIMVGGSYGAGNYAMCGRAYEPRFLFSWPSHHIAVMGPQQLGGVLDTIKRDAAAKEKRALDEATLQAARKKLESQIERESDPFFATARLWDDGILDPRDTRTILAICLSATHSQPFRGTMAWGVFRH